MPDYTPGQPMEEILASIKRIIAEDAPLPQSGHAPDADESEEPLELGDPIETRESHEPEAFVPPAIEPFVADPVETPSPSPEPMAFVPRPIEEVAKPAAPEAVIAPATPPQTTPEPKKTVVDEQALLSAASEAASKQALAALSALNVDPMAGPNTLEGLVREMLRPMLSQWLDVNLPGIVERMVAREIKRLGER